MKRKTVFDAIGDVGHDEDFESSRPKSPTQEPPGSWAKIVVMRERVERGEDLWHEEDFDDHNCTHEQHVHAKSMMALLRVGGRLPSEKESEA